MRKCKSWRSQTQNEPVWPATVQWLQWFLSHTFNTHLVCTGPSVQVIIRDTPTKRLTRSITPVFSYLFFFFFISGIIRISESSETVYRPGNMALSRIYCGKMQSWKTSYYLRCHMLSRKLMYTSDIIWPGPELQDKLLTTSSLRATNLVIGQQWHGVIRILFHDFFHVAHS